MTTEYATPQSASPDSSASLGDDLLPSRPVAAQFLKLMGNPSLSLDQIVPLLRADPLIAAEVLRIANSPLFGCRFRIKSILHAVALMGAERIDMVVLTAAMRALVDTRQGMLPHNCWRHSLATALCCEKLAETAGLSAELCYIAGLIHDLGHLALVRAFPEYETAVRLAISHGVDLLTAEREFCGIDHCEAGRRLLGQWGFPLELQNVAARHKDPAGGKGFDGRLITLVARCSQLADAMDMPVFRGIVIAHPATPEFEGELSTVAEAVATRLNAIELSLL